MGARELYLAAVAKPGDTVLIGFAHELTNEDIEALDESFSVLADQGIKVGFIDQVSSMVVVKGDREPDSHECSRVQALDGNDEPLDFVHCGICGKVEDREPVEHAPGRAVCCELCSRTGQTVCRDEV